MSNTTNQHPTLTGSEILWATLAGEGTTTVFGYPGGAILPVYDALRKFPTIHHVLVRHEQGAAHMADGYARASGRPGVCMATSGPGATNLVTGLATAMLDSHPRRRHHRPGLLQGPRLRRLPGDRHHRHHPAHHQAQLPRHARRRHRARRARGLSDRDLRPPRPRPHRHHQGRATSLRALRLRRRRARALSPAPDAARRIAAPSAKPSSSSSNRRSPSSSPATASSNPAPSARSSPSPNRSRFPSPPRCSASAPSPPAIHSHSA